MLRDILGSITRKWASSGYGWWPAIHVGMSKVIGHSTRLEILDVPFRGIPDEWERLVACLEDIDSLLNIPYRK